MQIEIRKVKIQSVTFRCRRNYSPRCLALTLTVVVQFCLQLYPRAVFGYPMSTSMQCIISHLSQRPPLIFCRSCDLASGFLPASFCSMFLLHPDIQTFPSLILVVSIYSASFITPVPMDYSYNSHTLIIHAFSSRNDIPSRLATIRNCPVSRMIAPPICRLTWCMYLIGEFCSEVSKWYGLRLSTTPSQICGSPKMKCVAPVSF
jgi:hypothetical protein